MLLVAVHYSPLFRLDLSAREVFFAYSQLSGSKQWKSIDQLMNQSVQKDYNKGILLKIGLIASNCSLAHLK